MVEGNGSTAPQEGVLEEIVRRCDALTPEQFITPPLKRDADMRIACTANDRIKRKFTLMITLATEIFALEEEQKKAILDGLKIIFKGRRDGSFDLGHELATEGTPLQVTDKTIRQLQNEIDQKSEFADIVDRSFWYDVRKQHPDLKAHASLHICSDWSLCWKETDTDIDTFRPWEKIGSLAELGKELQRLLRI